MTLANKLNVQQEAVQRVDLAVRMEHASRLEHEIREREVLDAVRYARRVDVKMVDLLKLTGFSRSGLYAKLKLALEAAEEDELETLPR